MQQILAFALFIVLPLLLAWLFAPLYTGSATIKDGSPYTTTDPELFDLSVVIPCYNEETRLPKMLDPALKFLKRWSSENNLTYEIILVDDGSEDLTTQVMLSYMRKSFKNIRTIKEPVNVGKGAALRHGVFVSRGKYVLIADGDGATEFSDLDALWKGMKSIETKSLMDSGGLRGVIHVEDSQGFVLGSRAHMEEKSISTRAWYRTILMKGFHLLVRTLITSKIRDTQCGFKLFTRSTALILFGNLHLDRWAFDVELVYNAEQLGVPMLEIDVNWTEVEGSKLIRNKLDVVKTSLTMARDMFAVKFAYSVNWWSLGPIPRRIA
jgi:dolichyl-phosphate beta-glucosyltransferase